MALRANGYDPATPYVPKHSYVSPYAVDFKDPDYGAIFHQRAQRLDTIRRDDAWHIVKRFYADGNACAFIEDWLCTYDPRLGARGLPTTIPLILFPRQIEYIELLEESYATGQDIVVGKSRDMGVSIVSLAWMTYKWLFAPGFKGSVGSRKEDLVDKIGNPDSLMEKVRMYLRFLPNELLPLGYNERKHARRMNIVNETLGSSITGEAGDNIGRGGRSTAYLVDEAAFLERPESIDAALSQNCNMRIDISTPNGPANPFANKWFHNEEIKAFSFHWTQDPRKDREWYDKEKKRLQDPRVIAQELDLDFDTSGEESVIRVEWIDASVQLKKWLRQQDLLPNPEEFPTISGADIGGGVAENTYVAVSGPIVGPLTAWIDGDTTRTAERLTRLAKKDGAGKLKYDSIGVGKGVASTLKRLPVDSAGVNVGAAPTTRMWPDGKRSKDKFRNLKAEVWWTLRDRLRKTYDHWCYINDEETGAFYKLEELILLSDEDEEFLRQLSLPGYKVLETGKIQIESKDELARRGVRSPDRAEALIIALSPVRSKMKIRRATGLAL